MKRPETPCISSQRWGSWSQSAFMVECSQASVLASEYSSLFGASVSKPQATS